MSGEGRGWIVLSRELVADLLDLVDAELEAAREELAASWRRAGWILVFFGAAVALAFWVVALVAYTLVAVAARWLPAWGAGLAVAVLFLLAAALLAGLGWWRARRLKNPIDVAIRRLREHLEWWRSEVTLHPPAGSSEGDDESAGRRPS